MIVLEKETSRRRLYRVLIVNSIHTSASLWYVKDSDR
jgi:hypothetical protein